MKFERLETASGALAVTRVGGGECLIVPIHGWACRRSHWAGQLSLMSAFGEVLAIDLPGHGDSAQTLPVAASVKGLAEQLAALIEQQRNKRPVLLLGHSMGGAVALEAARLMENVSGVVLVDTFVIPYGDVSEQMASEIESAFADDFVAAMGNLIEANTCDDLPAVLKQLLHHDMASAAPSWALPLWGDLLRWQPNEALAANKGRTFAINGGILPDVARQRCADFLTERVLPEAKHFPHFERPAAFNALLTTVLTEITQAR